jgi:heme-degrading monooxygenase HmoA
VVVVVFRARVKPNIGKDYEEMDARMAELAAKMPGFVSYRTFASADGEELAVIEFESHETVAAWREHPEHREAQRLGRDAGSPNTGLRYATWRETIRSRGDSTRGRRTLRMDATFFIDPALADRHRPRRSALVRGERRLVDTARDRHAGALLVAS